MTFRTGIVVLAAAGLALSGCTSGSDPAQDDAVCPRPPMRPAP